MSDQDAHPDLAELDAARTGEATATTQAHVQGCAECRQTLADLVAIADGLDVAVPQIPDAVEQRILWNARKEAARIRRGRFRGVTIRRAAALAAGVMLALGILRAVVPWREPADVDGNGVVDVRDAFLIARSIRTATVPPARLDVNGDRTVDAADADVVARTAVALGKRS